jgi:hypothetical protein
VLSDRFADAVTTTAATLAIVGSLASQSPEPVELSEVSSHRSDPFASNVLHNA